MLTITHHHIVIVIIITTPPKSSSYAGGKMPMLILVPLYHSNAQNLQSKLDCHPYSPDGQTETQKFKLGLFRLKNP